MRMELTAALHHSAFRGAGPVTYDALRSQKTVAQHHSAPKSAGPVSHNVLRNQNTARDGVLRDVRELRCGGKVAGRQSLVDVRRQARVQQRTAEQIVDPVPLVPMLHDVVPHMVEPLVDILAPLDFCVAEQVIEVPKIVCPPRAARTVLRAPQTAELLVDVPTVVSYSSLKQHIVEQIVDIPAPGRAGGEGVEVFKFSLDRIQQRFLEQHVGIPVPRGRGRLAGLQGSSPGQSSTAFVEQIGHIPGGSLQGFRPRQGSTASSSYSPAGSDYDADEPGIGFFALFPA